MMTIVFDDEVVGKKKSRIAFDDEAIANDVPRPGMSKVKPAEQKSYGVSDFLRGVTDIPRTIGEVPLAMGSGMAAAPIGSAMAFARQVLGGGLGNPAASKDAAKQAAEFASKYTYEPTTDAGKTIVGGLNSALGAVAPAFPAMLGGEMAAIQSGMNSGVLSSAAKMVTPKEKPTINAETAILANKFQEMGGKVPLHALTDNPRLKMLGERLDTMPLSGSPRVANKEIINRQLLKQIGGDESQGLLTPGSYAPAMSRTGEGIGRVYEGAAVPRASIKTDRIQADLRLHTAEAERAAQGFIDRLGVMSGENGVIPGKALRELDSKIGERMRSAGTDVDTRAVLSDLQNALRDGLEQNIPSSHVPVLRDLRMKYAKGMFLEPIVAKGSFEGVMPSELMSRQLSTEGGRHRIARQAAGEMGDLSTIGGKFLKDRLPLQQGILSGIGSAVAAIPGITVGNLYNRIGPMISERKVAQVMNTRAGKGYGNELPQLELPKQNQVVPFSHEGVLMQRGDPYTPNWTYGRPDANVNVGMPDGPPMLQNKSAMDGVAQQRAYDLNRDRAAGASAEQAAEIYAAQEKAALRRYKGGSEAGVLLDLDPITGRLRPASEGMKGATPDTVYNAERYVDSAAQKISAGKTFDMTLLEKNAWSKRKVDIAEAAPQMRGLSDREIVGKMQDRQWVADTIKKARDKASGFDEISKRSQDAQAIRNAAQAREKMLDLSDALEEQLTGTRPTANSSQGPKTRGAIRNGILNQQQPGVLSEQ